MKDLKSLSGGLKKIIKEIDGQKPSQGKLDKELAAAIKIHKKLEGK